MTIWKKGMILNYCQDCFRYLFYHKKHTGAASGAQVTFKDPENLVFIKTKSVTNFGLIFIHV